MSIPNIYADKVKHLLKPHERTEILRRVRQGFREEAERQGLEQRITDTPEFRVGDTVYVRGVGKPDKPGTVRAPGTRKQIGPKRYPMWSGNPRMRG